MGKIKILLADDHAVVRMGLISLLSMEQDLDVIAEARDGNEAISRAEASHPDVAILDLMMPKCDGISATEEIRKVLPNCKIIILTSFGTSDGIAKALKAGANGALLKNSAEVELVPAIHLVLDGGEFISKEIQEQFAIDPPIESLTKRQIEILESIARGLSNDDIAKQYGIAKITVKNHIQAIFTRIGASSRTEAATIALRKHLLKI